MKFPEIFDRLMDAILEGESVWIDYEKSGFKDHERSKRKITPSRFTLVERPSNYYHRICVEAHCHLRNDTRVFAVYRIKSIRSV